MSFPVDDFLIHRFYYSTTVFLRQAMPQYSSPLTLYTAIVYNTTILTERRLAICRVLVSSDCTVYHGCCFLHRSYFCCITPVQRPFYLCYIPPSGQQSALPCCLFSHRQSPACLAQSAVCSQSATLLCKPDIIAFSNVSYGCEISRICAMAQRLPALYRHIYPLVF